MLKKSNVLIAVFLLSAVMMLPMASVMAQDTTIAIKDAVDGDNTIQVPADTPPGTLVFVNITIEDVTLLAGYQLNVSFDTRLLNFTAASDLVYPDDHIFFDLDPIKTPPDFETTPGTVMWGCAVGPSAPQDHFNGSGIMCQIRFHTVKNGTGEPTSCNITVETTGNFPTQLIEPDGETEIPFIAINATYIIPEFPTTTILIIFLTATLIAVVVTRKTLIRRSKFLDAR